MQFECDIFTVQDSSFNPVPPMKQLSLSIKTHSNKINNASDSINHSSNDSISTTATAASSVKQQEQTTTTTTTTLTTTSLDFYNGDLCCAQTVEVYDSTRCLWHQIIGLWNWSTNACARARAHTHTYTHTHTHTHTHAHTCTRMLACMSTL